MARFSLDEGTSGSKRKKRSDEEEDDLKKRTCGGGEGETSESSSSEEEQELEEEKEVEESEEVHDEVHGYEEIAERGKDGGFPGGTMDKEFKFRIDPDVLDCSICFEPLRPPIFQCRNGHIACSYCCPKLLNKCHFCCQPIGRRGRCLALEKVLESIMSPCQYANYGCRAILSFAKKALHEETCSHAALFCPISNCLFSGSNSLLISHAKRKHCNISENFCFDRTFRIALEKQQPFVIMLGEDSHLFLLLNSHDTYPGNVLSVICMASNNLEYEFPCELRLETRESSLRLRTKAQKVKKWNGVDHCKDFLMVPEGFNASTSHLSIIVCIHKSLGVLMT